MALDSEMVPTNGAASSLPPCPLENLPLELHQYIHGLENRVARLEAEQARMSAAMINAGKFIFESAQGKMVMMAFPKEMQNRLREFFSGNAVTEKVNGNS